MPGIESLLASLPLSFITEGLCACSLETFTVGNVRTGRIRQGKPEQRVTAINNCACAQIGIKRKCAGFESAEVIDPSTFAKLGDRCLAQKWKSLGTKGARSASLMLGILRSFCGQPSRSRPVAENS
ncbi:hypothetical protein NL676_034134 [Syzygium grande]|nr:hypothetical protein NL676_034134 [Syzygium grande]